MTAIAAIAGVTRLVVLPGGRRPEGDAVQFDVTSSAANAVLARLSDLAIPADVQHVDTVLPARTAAPAPQLLARDQPPVWALVEAHIRNDAVYAPGFYLLLVFAGLIAATGILTNSQILIVAVVAGLTGVVSLTGSRAGPLVGVFISVTTFPAAADIGLSAAYGSWSELTGSLLQLLLNVVLLIAVGAGGLRLQRRIWHRHGRGGRAEAAGTRL